MLQSGVELGDRYRLEEKLGAGGMGEVWRATDQLLGRVVAVKAMLATVAGDPEFARRFLTEAQAMAQVNHPAVASIHDFGTSRGITYLVMEFVDGESLDRLLARTGRLTPAVTMGLIAQAAKGLQAVHERGIVHRDIKPANLMIRRDGSLLITDFGISRSGEGSRLTASGAVLGTPTYLSPEQVLGRPANALSDIYSLGLTAYECLAGHRPFEGDNPYAVALQRLQAAPRTMGVTLPVPVLAVVERALATDPAGRWPSAAVLAGAAEIAANAIDNSVSPQGMSNSPAGAPGGGFGGLHRPAGAPGVDAAVPPNTADRVGGASRPGTAGRAMAGRGWALVAAVLAMVIVGGAGGWALTRRHPDAAGTAPAVSWVTRPGASAGPAKNNGLDGFTACGPVLCPTKPSCWNGVVSISGKALQPERLDCGASHTWETFAAVVLPEGADLDPEGMVDRADIAPSCSATVMAARSKDPAITRSWVRDAWPMQQPDGSWIAHCLARPESGDYDRAAF